MMQHGTVATICGTRYLINVWHVTRHSDWDLRKAVDGLVGNVNGKDEKMINCLEKKASPQV